MYMFALYLKGETVSFLCFLCFFLPFILMVSAEWITTTTLFKWNPLITLNYAETVPIILRKNDRASFCYKSFVYFLIFVNVCVCKTVRVFRATEDLLEVSAIPCEQLSHAKNPFCPFVFVSHSQLTTTE